MSWKCSCTQTNDDAAIICISCGKKMPKYLGVKIDFETTELNAEQLSLWYLLIANNYLETIKDSNHKIEDFLKQYRTLLSKEISLREELIQLKNELIKNGENCLKLLEAATKNGYSPQFKDEDGATLDCAVIKSLCFFEKGFMNFQTGDFAKAIDDFQNSFNADPNQRSIFYIAISTIRLPVEGGSFFGGKKTEEAKANKAKKEAELLKKTIQFMPNTFYGIKAAAMLFSDYGIMITQQDFKSE